MDLLGNLFSLPVLSVRQPWASYLVSGMKTIELRSWSSGYRGWLWIHAGKKPDLLAMEMLDLEPSEFGCGGLVGLARLEDCVPINSEEAWLQLRADHLSPGYFGGPCYGWRFSDALSLSSVVPCPGELGLFRLSGLTRERILPQFSSGLHRDFMKQVGGLALAT